MEMNVKEEKTQPDEKGAEQIAISITHVNRRSPLNPIASHSRAKLSKEVLAKRKSTPGTISKSKLNNLLNSAERSVEKTSLNEITHEKIEDTLKQYGSQKSGFESQSIQTLNHATPTVSGRGFNPFVLSSRDLSKTKLKSSSPKNSPPSSSQRSLLLFPSSPPLKSTNNSPTGKKQVTFPRKTKEEIHDSVKKEITSNVENLTTTTTTTSDRIITEKQNGEKPNAESMFGVKLKSSQSPTSVKARAQALLNNNANSPPKLALHPLEKKSINLSPSSSPGAKAKQSSSSSLSSIIPQKIDASKPGTHEEKSNSGASIFGVKLRKAGSAQSLKNWIRNDSHDAKESDIDEPKTAAVGTGVSNFIKMRQQIFENKSK